MEKAKELPRELIRPYFLVKSSYSWFRSVWSAVIVLSL